MTRVITALRVLGLCLGLVAGASSAEAGVLGDQVQLDFLFDTKATLFKALGTGTVAPTATFDAFNQIQLVAADTTLTLTNIFGTEVTFIPTPFPGGFNGFELTDLSHAGITDVAFDPATTIAGLGAANLSFDGDHIFLDLNGVQFPTDAVVELDITAAPPSDVPEPGTLALLAVGLLGAGRVMRRRNASRNLPRTLAAA